MTESKQQKTFTFLSRCAPYGSNRPKLCLDAALATAVFEQKVNYVFMDDGVLQLLGKQNADAIHRSTLGSELKTLELYGIDKVLVHEASLNSRNLRVEDLVLPVELLSDESLRVLVNTSDQVLNL